ncbi:MAG: signal peptidase I [Aliiglaciecola sp.]|uniref:signal peptidase I n=1 Tax=Aliiglaciecola sp. M165 TaxID=2593649 RepID=UPI0011810A05|nr:signal peptidase I [Aliiglaciecola sp. M165]TRY32645.1 signal peptidase I [Aliiglaciecola sp. M165]
MTDKLKTLAKENWGFLLIILLMFASRSSLADWYHVPSGSMLPTIEVGDRIFVNKLAYRLEVPFTDVPIMQTGSPERGDIVVFNSIAANERLVKRVIGMPGDQISMTNNQLIINGHVIQYQNEQESHFYSEDLLGLQHQVQFVPVPSPKHSFDTIVVPADHYFVMGDNRNNSRDSRYYGFVSAAELQGKAIGVIASFDSKNYYLPKENRNFIKLI